MANYYKNLAENLQAKKNQLLAEVTQTRNNQAGYLPGSMETEIDPTLTPEEQMQRDMEIAAAGGPAAWQAQQQAQAAAAAAAAAPAVAPAAPAFVGRGPLMGAKDQAAYDKMIGDVMKARGMAVPSLRSGKGGNYAEWKAAVDSRNAALRDANINVRSRQNQLRDQIATARENLAAAKAAGDAAAVQKYQQELNTSQRMKRNINVDTGAFVQNDTGQQLRVAGEQSQASWERKKADFKSRTGMDYDPSNPQHTRVMQNPNMSPEATQTALTVGAFNQRYDAQRAENARKMGETDRALDTAKFEYDKSFKTVVDPTKMVGPGIPATYDVPKRFVDEWERQQAEKGQVPPKVDFDRRGIDYPGISDAWEAERDRRKAEKERLRSEPAPPGEVGNDAETMQAASRITVNKPNTMNMMGNTVERARANAATTPPIQRATVTTPVPGAVQSSGTRPMPPVEGGMNVPLDINDFENPQARRPTGRQVTTVARNMSGSMPRLS